jgi:hypothetical protein
MDTESSILITGARSPVALHLTRLLGISGHRVILVDHLKHPISAASRYATRYYQIPAFALQPKVAFKALSKIIASENIKLVIPTCEEVLHLGAIWQKNHMGIKLFAPSISMLSQVHNKYSFIQLCDKIGLPTPRTYLLENEADLTAQEMTAAKKVFKSVWSRFGSDVLIQPDVTKLRRIQPTISAPWIAQDFLAGNEISAYAVAHQGRVVALAAYQGIVRAGPGAAVCFQSVDTNIVRSFVTNFVQGTAWTGQISFDFIQTDNGQVLPLECNPRATSGLHFFTDGATFSRAVCTGVGEVIPDVSGSLTVRLALWFYGIPMIARRNDRKTFLDALRLSEEVIDWPNDPVGWATQVRSLAEFSGLALRHWTRLERASTWGIEWNGKDQSSMS